MRMSVMPCANCSRPGEKGAKRHVVCLANRMSNSSPKREAITLLRSYRELVAGIHQEKSHTGLQYYPSHGPNDPASTNPVGQPWMCARPWNPALLLPQRHRRTLVSSIIQSIPLIAGNHCRGPTLGARDLAWMQGSQQLPSGVCAGEWRRSATTLGRPSLCPRGYISPGYLFILITNNSRASPSSLQARGARRERCTPTQGAGSVRECIIRVRRRRITAATSSGTREQVLGLATTPPALVILPRATYHR